jgi:hypothetical protein
MGRFARAARWILLALFCGLGLYSLLAAYQSASFSVVASPMMAEVYKTRAVLLLPISILLFAIGILLFILLARARQR